VTVTDAAYNEDAHWIALDELRAQLGFHAVMLAAIERLVEEH
jgi:hypothetical protein